MHFRFGLEYVLLYVGFKKLSGPFMFPIRPCRSWRGFQWWKMSLALKTHWGLCVSFCRGDDALKCKSPHNQLIAWVAAYFTWYLITLLFPMGYRALKQETRFPLPFWPIGPEWRSYCDHISWSVSESRLVVYTAEKYEEAGCNIIGDLGPLDHRWSPDGAYGYDCNKWCS